MYHIGDRAVKVDVKAAAVGHLVNVDVVGKHNVTRRRLEEDRANTIRRRAYSATNREAAGIQDRQRTDVLSDTAHRHRTGRVQHHITGAATRHTPDVADTHVIGATRAQGQRHAIACFNIRERDVPGRSAAHPGVVDSMQHAACAAAKVECASRRHKAAAQADIGRSGDRQTITEGKLIRRAITQGDRTAVSERRRTTQAVDVAGHHQIKGASANAQRTGGRDIIDKAHGAIVSRGRHRHAVSGYSTIKGRTP